MIHLLPIGLPIGGERLVPANFGHKATLWWDTGSTRRLTLGRNQSPEIALSSPQITWYFLERLLLVTMSGKLGRCGSVHRTL